MSLVGFGCKGNGNIFPGGRNRKWKLKDEDGDSW